MSDQKIYLLCVWTEGQTDERRAAANPWRAVLEEPRTGKQWGFSEPKALVAFLKRERMGESANERMSE